MWGLRARAAGRRAREGKTAAGRLNRREVTLKRHMIERLAIAILVLVTAAFVSACAQNEPNTGERVEQALKDANLEDVNVDWDRDANVVHLKGKVDDPNQKQRADEIANQIVGTSGKVLNELEVEGMSGEVPADNRDDAIKEMIDAKLEEDPALKERNINVDVNNGVVTLTGEVNSQAEKTKLGAVVKEVEGVKDFANEVKVEPRDPRTPDDRRNPRNDKRNPR
jgi:osmotically-inducible protein OsmY